MTWQATWWEIFGEEPPIPGSREESVQDVLSTLVAGRDCAWFEPYTPTGDGAGFLTALWRMAFDAEVGEPEWFVSEYALPVPPEWREAIPYTYRCVDLACGDRERLLIVELKTEAGSYRADQIPDYLRLVRHRHPDHATDVVLLGPHKPAVMPAHDDRQRYVELTWAEVSPLVRSEFPDDARAAQLSRFLDDQFPVPSSTSPVAAAPPRMPGSGTDPRQASAVAATALRDDENSAVAMALRMAPSVARASRGDRTERGIDVAFTGEQHARSAQREIANALAEHGWADRVSVWLWRTSSGGPPATPSGHALGLELRLAPRLEQGSDRPERRRDGPRP